MSFDLNPLASMRPTVFIHTNARQIVGAQVARHALKRNSAHPERFDVRLIEAESHAFIEQRHGQSYRREGLPVVWDANDLQSFTPLRFAVPAEMGYQGRAVVIDPDIFAIGDINELLERDMQSHAVLARAIPAKAGEPEHFASSVMLLDCAKLSHWQAERQFGELFEGSRDYRDWMWLLDEPAGSVGALETVWNDFDRLAPDTRMLHNTNRKTQPWKSGLPAEFVTNGRSRLQRLKQRLRRVGNRLVAGDAPNGRYKTHPDPAQQQHFFRLVGECLDLGVFSQRFLEDEMARRHLRPDALACVELARRAG
ncbi:hypothetical protein [uncultured Nevskia sp.]|uniref:hypothetical protein n=1 Tax=uncultured Nevskia sp. TaxID=228950 RepID=UPI0025FBFA47|nr:hypothetical protein [uncultured Nevskia sp.]